MMKGEEGTFIIVKYMHHSTQKTPQRTSGAERLGQKGPKAMGAVRGRGWRAILVAHSMTHDEWEGGP